MGSLLKNLRILSKSYAAVKVSSISLDNGQQIWKSFLSGMRIKNYYSTKKTERELTIRNIFEDRERENKQKDKQEFMHTIEIYKSKLKKTGSVEFIYTALKNMKKFGVHEDIEVYRKLIDILPKGPYVPTNMLQSEFFYFPRQQEVIIHLLMQMEENGVMPDPEMGDLLLAIFGKRGYPVRRYWRMMYWMAKFKNVNPWPVPKYNLTTDPLELGKMAVSRISDADLESELSVYCTDEIENSVDKTWITSCQSPIQKKLLNNHPINMPINIEGPFRVWLRRTPVNYFVMKTDLIKERKKPTFKDYDDIVDLRIPFFTVPNRDDVIPKKSVHEQKDGIIYAIVATGTSTKDSLLSWIRILEKNGHTRLGKVPILFKFSSSTADFSAVKIDTPPILLGNNVSNLDNKTDASG